MVKLGWVEMFVREKEKRIRGCGQNQMEVTVGVDFWRSCEVQCPRASNICY